MIGPRETLDVDAAVLDPADHFESPKNVVRDPRLTKGEKQRVLESWIRDAQIPSQAEAENVRARSGGDCTTVRFLTCEVRSWAD